ncbi:hypothetical protein [Granulicella sp. dw_53]|uniref:hypothetical protein n=1 Tax=Granulicella sp. dw_53 TaxID=2719792 RepID=UPI0021075DB2|nr:hypothetical protein [Granulicella sp. dw_53]
MSPYDLFWSALNEGPDMRSVIDETVPWTPSTEEEKDSVRRQMQRLLDTSHFKNSRRYPALLRFIVEETLEGRGEFLKERLLGIRVFDRPADYDTAADPIVRVTIAEIRKRIAQYYHEEAHDSEMRIELPSGRYEPEFRPRREFGSDRRSMETISAAEVDTPLLAMPLPIEPTPLPTASWLSGRRRWALLAVPLVLLLIVSFGWRWLHPSALDELWEPLLSSHRTILMCLPAGAGDQNGANPGRFQNGLANTTDSTAPAPARRVPTFLDHESLGENVVFSDMLATLKIADLMAVHQNEYRLRLNVLTTLDDLRQGPAVLIGGLDNQWTMRALAPLRFHFVGSDAEEYWISDTENPQKRDWALDLKTQYAAVNHDFALIARVHNEQTGELEVIVAGIGMSGTAAAGEFLVDPHRVEELRRRVGAGFRNRDFEAVLSTDVVNGIAGSPKILAVAVW